MKITCDRCDSKYSIADDKVLGRKVKVRCKNCGNSILVDGTADASSGDSSANDAAASEASPSDDAVDAPISEAKKKEWSVNLSDDDSRDMDTAELVAGWVDGSVTVDAFVWKDGMGDWKPIMEVSELKSKLLAAKPMDDGVVSSAGKADDAIGDLFGGVDLAGSGADVPDATTKAAPAAKTGVRNESSVLFSLDSLNDGGAAEKKTDASDVFGSSLGGAGMLGGNADLLTAPAAEPPPAPAGARVESGSSKHNVGIIAAIAAVVVLGLGGMFFLGGSDDAKVEAAAEEARKKAEEEVAAKLAERQKELDAEMDRLKAEREKLENDLKQAREEAEAKGEDPAEAEAKLKAELEAKKKEEEEARAKAASATKPSTTTTASKSTSTSTKSTSSSSSSSSSSASSGGAAFDKSAAASALGAAAANAAACKKPGGPTGHGKVQVTFSTSGRVTSANVVSGPFGGTSVGGCVATTFRRARIPAFSGSPVTVAKSFSIQ